MVGVTSAGASDRVTWREAADSFSDFENDAGRAIANGRLVGEPSPDRVMCIPDAFSACACDHFANEVGTLPRLSKERLLRELDARTFGSGADDRIHVPDEDRSGEAGRRRDVSHDRQAIPVLKHLFHQFARRPCGSHSVYGRRRYLDARVLSGWRPPVTEIIVDCLSTHGMPLEMLDAGDNLFAYRDAVDRGGLREGESPVVLGRPRMTAAARKARPYDSDRLDETCGRPAG
jgi:hypothetical protein